MLVGSRFITIYYKSHEVKCIHIAAEKLFQKISKASSVEYEIGASLIETNPFDSFSYLHAMTSDCNSSHVK